jgi:hypothetical protein
VRGGAQIGFRQVAVEEAVAARRAERDVLRRPVTREPVVRTDFASDFLLGLNLVGGVADGRA